MNNSLIDPITRDDERDLTVDHTDAQAALEAVRREARNEARREAISIVSGYGCCHVPDEIQDAILGMMEDTYDE